LNPIHIEAEAERFRLLVGLPPSQDLLLCAKHLFVAAMIAPAADQPHARQAFDNRCCRRDPHDAHSAVRPNGWRH